MKETEFVTYQQWQAYAARIENRARGFEIYVDDKLACETPVNTSASYFLNSLEVGGLA